MKEGEGGGREKGEEGEEYRSEGRGVCEYVCCMQNNLMKKEKQDKRVFKQRSTVP